MHVCIDRSANERIIQVIVSGESIVRLVNSSLPQFAACLLAYREAMSPWVALERAMVAEAIDAAVRAATEPAPAPAETVRATPPDRGTADRPADTRYRAEARTVLERLGQRMRQIDEAAMAESACWGQLVVSRLEMDGLGAP
jgi:hypothetical protein